MNEETSAIIGGFYFLFLALTLFRN